MDGMGRRSCSPLRVDLRKMLYSLDTILNCCYESYEYLESMKILGSILELA